MRFKAQLSVLLLTISAQQMSYAKQIDGSPLQKVDQAAAKVFPVSNIGILKWRNTQRPEKVEVCTVTLISPKFAITAKHCTQDMNDSTKDTQYILRIGNAKDTQADYDIDDTIEFQNTDVSLIKISPVKLSADISEFPMLSAPSESDLKTTSVYGYPVTSQNLDLHFSRCSAKRDSDASLLTHFCSTEVGVSGAPIFSTDQSGGFKIVAIHSGSNFFSGNRASIITDSLLQNINSELSK